MEEGLFHNQVFVDFITENAVAVIGHGQAHNEVDKVNPRTRKTEKVCPRYPTIPCSVHQKSANEARASKEFNFKGVPASFVCDSSGKMVEKVGGMSPQKFIDSMTGVIRSSGKRPITGSMIAKMQKDLVKGDKSLAKGKFKKALAAYTKVAENEKYPEFIRARGKAKADGMPEVAMVAVQTALGLAPRKVKTALKKLKKEVAPFAEAKAALDAALAELEK
jgi:hypothetical protein